MVPRPSRPPAWAGYLVVAGLLSVVCVCLRGTAHDVLLSCVSASSAVAVAVGARLHRPVRAGAWWCMAAGMGCWALGDALFTLVYDVLGSQAYPAPPDVAYLLAYPLLGASLLSLARRARPGQDLEGVIDATILSVGAGLMSWTFLLRPALSSLGDDLLGGAVSAAYPVGDVFVLAMFVRLMSAAGARSASFRLLTAAAAAMLVADVSYQVAYAATGYDGVGSDPFFLVAYALWGTAALHPSMRRLSDPGPQQGGELGPGRLLLLAGASLLAPATLAVQLLAGVSLSAWSVVVTSAVLFLLVVARMWTLLRRLRVQAAQLRELARTDALTGLANRRTAEAELDRARERAAASGAPLVVAVLDLDRFKAFNDTFGHPAGDALLVGCARAWGTELAGTGVLAARWGGEEFLVLAEGLDPARVQELLERMRAVVPSGQSFSAGLARWDGAEPAAELFARADRALYAAKAAGRARTCPAPEPTGTTAAEPAAEAAAGPDVGPGAEPDVGPAGGRPAARGTAPAL